MLADWTRLSDSAPDLTVLRLQTPPIPNGGGSQYLSCSIPASGIGRKNLWYRNDKVGVLTGGHETSAAMRLGAGSVDGRISLVALWSGDRIDQDGYVAELVGGAATTSVRLRKGDGTVLGSAASVAFGTWAHVLLQVRYDRAGNQEIWLATNNLSLNPTTSPVWVRAFDPILVLRHAATRSGRTGFGMSSGQYSSVLSIDEIVVRSTLSSVT